MVILLDDHRSNLAGEPVGNTATVKAELGETTAKLFSSGASGKTNL
ncbi:hypothetical protein N2597_33640 (plasmid) [Rhizobium sophoriradicis]|nr:hypothetical protein N2597_33640 [Rhizobium leguminosarum bv. phaseoli]